MKKSEIKDIVNNLSREDLPLLIKISSIEGLLYSINYIERLVRSSEFYVIWREYNRVHQEAAIDAIEGINTADYVGLNLELHHYPYSLFEICQIVGSQILLEKEITDPFEVARVVLEEHLAGNIGYVPLLITDHQKFHVDLLELEEDHIQGNYKQFIKSYGLKLRE